MTRWRTGGIAEEEESCRTEDIEAAAAGPAVWRQPEAHVGHSAYTETSAAAACYAAVLVGAVRGESKEHVAAAAAAADVAAR